MPCRTFAASFRHSHLPRTLLVVALLWGCLPTSASAHLLTHHVGMMTETWLNQGNGHQIWDYEFKQLIEKNLYKDGNPIYQDLEMVFNICYGGGMIDWIAGHGGFKGHWSASSSVTAQKISRQEWSTSIDPTPTLGGQWKFPGLLSNAFTTTGRVINEYTNGYSPQYIKAIEDNPALTVKKLHETAVQKNYRNDKKVEEPGQYASSGAAADAMTIKGNADTKSQHAIAWSGGKVNEVDQHIFEKLIQVLEGVGYKGASGTIQKLFHEGPLEKPTASGVSTADWKNATEANLDAALAAMRTDLLKNEGKEKALIVVEGHGASVRETRQQKFKDGDPPIPGEGFTFDALHNTISLPLDVDDQLRLQEEVSNGLGGVLYDGLGLSRLAQPVLNWTTYAQSLTGAVGVYINDIFAGSIAPTGSRDDFVLPLSDSFLSQIHWSNLAPIDWNIRFDFASPTDSFQLSTEYDYFQDAGFSGQFDHYGLGVSNVLYQGSPAVPEPSTLVLILIAIPLLVARFGRRHWNRAA